MEQDNNRVNNPAAVAANEDKAQPMLPGNGLNQPPTSIGTSIDEPDSHADVENQEATPLKRKQQPYPMNYEEETSNEDEIGSSVYSDKLATIAHKCKLTPKKGLLYLIVCGIIIFILLLILIILVSIWPKSPATNLCTSSKCHYLSAKLLGGMNETIHPCENFWEFSCGGWLDHNPIPKSKSSWSVDKFEEYKLKVKVRMLISTQTYAPESNSVNMKLRRYYQSCMALEYTEADQDKPLKKIIQELGGWKVLRSFNLYDFDFTRALKKLQGEFRASPFFDVKVVPDPRIPERNIIKIIPAGLSLPDKLYYSTHENMVANAFRTYVKDVVQLLGATSPAASQFANEIFHYEQRIATVTPDKANYSDAVNTFHKLRLVELKAMSNSILWGEILKAIFPQINLNDQTEILVPFPKYLEDISSIISTTDKGNLNNYMMWRLADKYIPYLSKQYTEAKEMYRKEATGSIEPIPRWEFCIDETMWAFSHAVNILLAESCEYRSEKIRIVEELFETMKSALTTRISETPRFEEQLRNFANDKLRLMTLQVGTTLTNHSTLTELYFSLGVQKDDFFANTRAAATFIHQMEQIQLVNPSKSAILLNFIGKNLFGVHLLPTANKIVVSEASLQTSAFDIVNNNFKPLLLGTLGIQFGEAFAKAFGPEEGLYFASGSLLPETDSKVEELRSLIETKRSCLASFFTDIRLDDKPYIESTSLDTTLHLAAIQIAFDTLKSFGDPSEHSALPSLDEYSSNALFFLAYGQSQCAVSTLVFHSMEHLVYTSLSHDHRTRGVLRQMVEYTDAFSCSKSSEMYADFTCSESKKYQVQRNNRNNPEHSAALFIR